MEITLKKDRDRNEDICCRCGIPRRIGCHHTLPEPEDQVVWQCPGCSIIIPDTRYKAAAYNYDCPECGNYTIARFNAKLTSELKPRKPRDAFNKKGA